MTVCVYVQYIVCIHRHSLAIHLISVWGESKRAFMFSMYPSWLKAIIKFTITGEEIMKKTKTETPYTLFLLICGLIATTRCKCVCDDEKWLENLALFQREAGDSPFGKLTSSADCCVPPSSPLPVESNVGRHAQKRRSQEDVLWIYDTKEGKCKACSHLGWGPLSNTEIYDTGDDTLSWTWDSLRVFVIRRMLEWMNTFKKIYKGG